MERDDNAYLLDMLHAVREAVAMRNRLVHGYFGIDLKLVWDTVCNDLPALITQLEPLDREDQRVTRGRGEIPHTLLDSPALVRPATDPPELGRALDASLPKVKFGLLCVNRIGFDHRQDGRGLSRGGTPTFCQRSV